MRDHPDERVAVAQTKSSHLSGHTDLSMEAVANIKSDLDISSILGFPAGSGGLYRPNNDQFKSKQSVLS